MKLFVVVVKFELKVASGEEISVVVVVVVDIGGVVVFVVVLVVVSVVDVVVVVAISITGHDALKINLELEIYDNEKIK
jgi:hypothetical protein